jgi:hypothetical protein
MKKYHVIFAGLLVGVLVGLLINRLAAGRSVMPMMAGPDLNTQPFNPVSLPEDSPSIVPLYAQPSMPIAYA